MRVEDLLIQNQMPAREAKGADFLRDNAKDTGTVGVASAAKTGVSEDLRTINVKDPFYKKEEAKDKSIVDEISKNGPISEEQWEQNRMILSSHTMTAEEYQKMEEEGFEPKDMEPSDFVDIADKIRLALAKGGADISMTGDISKETLEEMTGSSEAAAAAQQVLLKAQEFSGQGSLTDDQADYMLRGNLAPTADNIFRAVSSGSDGMPPVQDIDEAALEEMRPQIEEQISDAGLKVTEDSLADATRLIKNGLAITEENMQLLSDMKGRLVTDPAEIMKAISDAMKAGHAPSETMLIEGFSEMDKAIAAYETVNSDDAEKASRHIKENGGVLTIKELATLISDANETTAISDKAYTEVSKPEMQMQVDANALHEVSARRMLEETRLVMTIEANFTLISKGMEIDTMPLQQLVDELRDLEMSFGESMLRSGASDELSAHEMDVIEKQVSLYNETETKLDQLAEMPAVIMGHFADIEQVTVEKLHSKGMALSDEFKNATERYDTMRTEVRKDLGDSMKKAFRNVDDILSDIGLEESEENRRAVRILAYNQEEITKEAVQKIRSADSLVQKVFESMTPGVVTEMIKRGENPLDVRLADLQKEADEIRGVGTIEKDGEDFADFLWRMEKNGEINDDERQAYIGLYRLMHQITETDGAPIGALLAQGTEITMRNLMTATRSGKHSGREYRVDDENGVFAGFDKSVLSITQQIEMAFMTSRSADVRDTMTPEKLHAMGGEEAYLDLDPHQMATALENMENTAADERDRELDREFYEEQVSALRSATEADEKVYAALRRFDMPGSADNLAMMQQMMADRNSMYRDLYGRVKKRTTFEDIGADATALTDQGDEAMLDYMFEELVRDYGEYVKTPEDMAEAQRQLADIAENAMRDVLISDPESRSIDVRAMKQVTGALHAMDSLSKREETYSIPVMVADQMGNISLKIVRGKEEEKGAADIALDMPECGKIYAAMRASAEGITADIRTDSPASRDKLEAFIPELANRIKDSSGMDEVNVSVKLTGAINSDPIYDDIDVGDIEPAPEGTPIQTAKLYGMARAMVQSMGEILLK